MTSANAASVNDNGAGAGAASSAGVSSAAPAGFGPRLAGKVAFVTGGAGGIGAAIVRLFVAHGARVVVADRDADAGYALEKELDAVDQPRRKKISFVHMDVAQEDAWQKAMQQVRSPARGCSMFGGRSIFFFLPTYWLLGRTTDARVPRTGGEHVRPARRAGQLRGAVHVLGVGG